ncbi:MAG: Hsp20/alpha crystallin family protein [Candidatus Marinimicrobia bacterium]|nr:Hsp20/alpha crystallin family protein [Candidatus Neomarinimicrobiota bacterium]
MMLVKRNYSLPRIHSYYNNRLDNFFTDPFFNNELSEPIHWAPRMEVEETENDFLLNVEIPGLKKKDIDISVKDNVITISGEKKEKVHEKDSHYHLNEISYGKFSRSFQLPGNVDVDKIKGSWNAGVLTVEIPKNEVAKPRKIEIN